jgi:hypothetical protein
MSHQIYITVADAEVAKTFVEDTKETDSICYINEAGDDVEFGVVDIHYNETIGDAEKD